MSALTCTNMFQMRCLATQAVVDDVYLGYISIPELLALLGEALTASGSGSGAAVAAAMAVYRSLVAGVRWSLLQRALPKRTTESFESRVQICWQPFLGSDISGEYYCSSSLPDEYRVDMQCAWPTTGLLRI